MFSKSLVVILLSLGIAACNNPLQSSKSVSTITIPTSPGYANIALTAFNLGGGGNVSGVDISTSGVKFARGDVFGAYIFGSDRTWHLINGLTNMCPSGYPCAYFGWSPANTSDNQVGNTVNGVMELVGCPSSSSCAYMYEGGRIFYSSNISATSPSAITWCNTGFTQTTDTSNNVIGAGDPGPFMAVDPNNPAHVIAGTPATGLFETFNGTSCGAANWAAIPVGSIPLATANYPAYLIAFDPTSTATCHSGSGTCSKNVYISDSNGVYQTINAGTTWVLTAGSPTTVHHLKVSQAVAGGGNVWAVDASGNVWEYRAATWSKIAGITGGDVAINPLNGDHIAVTNGKNLWVSTNGSAASPAFTSYTGIFAAGDSPWALLNQVIYYTGANNLSFDSAQNDSLIMSGGQWIFQTTFPTASFSWSVLSSGIQGAVSLGNLQVGSKGSPTFGFEDIGACTFSIGTASTPPSSCSMASQFYYLTYTSGLSVAPGTTFMASKTSNDFGPGFDLSGYSTDGYQNTYAPFNTWNTTAAATGISQNGSGGYRVTLSSTSGLKSFAAGDTLTSKSIVCFLWKNYFVWSGFLNESCWPVTVVDGTHIDLNGSTYNAIAATPGYSYIAYTPAPPLSSWFGGGTVMNVTNNGSGLVRVQFPGGWNVGAHQTPVCISGVSMAGATVVNGCWTIAAVNGGTSIDLLGSSFAGGDSYLSGGTILFTGAPGGSVAASTPTNIAIYGGDTTFPYCTTNGGASWSQVTVAGVPAATGVTVTGGPYAGGTSSITVSNGAGMAYQKMLQLSSGRYLDESGASVSGNTITLTNSIPIGDSLATGSPIFSSTGGPFAAYFRTHQIAADQVTPNTFYYVNDSVGLVKWTGCGATTIVAPSSQGFLAAADNDQLKAVPGQAGHLFFTTGYVGSATHPAGTRLWRACNGNNNAAGSVTMQTVPGFFEVQALGFGHAAPGKTYPAIYVVGWYSSDNNINDAVYGIWRSIDDPNNGVTSTCSTSNTWTALASDTNGFPAGYPVGVEDIEGDPFIYGPYYILGSFGQYYGVQN